MYTPEFPLVSGDPTHDYAAFSDESHSDGNNRYMVIGGILCRSAIVHELASEITEIINSSRYREAIQWKTISARKVDLYKRVADAFFRWRERQLVDFSCIVFDSRRVDHERHSANDPAAGFFKFVYQHHLAHQRRYRPPSTFRCFHGNMDTPYDLRELKRCLNAGTPSRGLMIYNPYAQVEFRAVKQTRCLQIADLMIGAVGFMTNLQGGMPSTPKAEIARHIEDLAPVRVLHEPTLWPDAGFNIWHFQLS